ncbi:TetR/AcrR family transcriptional regulator [Streptomyces iconiensis]|uniref:TetR/AcrR family transcriptional regulator n=1 Tax=Streptomyces iconiensis TaxID=1384038 RepID=A0ABT6ZX47_9ACTN|nr:TetR/AcrR family transcriptional regulator [Streptomyces iconiensis]MDJ1133638.1 TetR/AcrR family transcriptional regulator [Streptomyces iconiensis]
MPKRGDRGGSKTRAHIAATATELFLERGFENVTIAEVAAAAGVSKVTVFSHFERKEDLLLDRLPGAVETVRTAIREREEGVGPVEAIRRVALALVDQGHALSGLSEGVEPFLRTIAESPALIARLRAFEHEIEQALATDLENDARFSGDHALVAALLIAAYRTVAVGTAQRRLAGGDLAEIATTHRRRLAQAFDTVEHGIAARTGAG